MAKLRHTANTKDNNEGSDFTPLPTGTEVIANIIKSERKDNSAGTGSYLMLVWKITSKMGKSRQLREYLNDDHPNVEAAKIANNKINSISQACDKVGVADSQEFHGISCKLTLGVKEADANYPASNTILKYEKAEDGVVPEATEETGEVTEEKDLPWAK